MSQKGPALSSLALSHPNGSKGFAPVLIVLIIILVAAGTFYIIKSVLPNFIPNQTNNSNEKTYELREVKFALTIPPDWTEAVWHAVLTGGNDPKGGKQFMIKDCGQKADDDEFLQITFSHSDNPENGIKNAVTAFPTDSIKTTFITGSGIQVSKLARNFNNISFYTYLLPTPKGFLQILGTKVCTSGLEDVYDSVVKSLELRS